MNIPERPISLRVEAVNIPEDLKWHKQWVCWRYEWNGTKWTKPPFQPNGFKASKTNPDHYSDFLSVVSAYERGGFDGIGFVLTAKDPFVAIDIDACLKGNEITEEAVGIIQALNSYTERSPSGSGIRIFVMGIIPRNINNRTKKVEIYSNGSYVTVTGQRWHP